MHDDGPGFERVAGPSAETAGGNDPDARTYAVDPLAPIVVDLTADEADVLVRAVVRPDVLVRARGGGEGAGTDGSPPGLHVGGEGNRLTVSTQRPRHDDPDGDGHRAGHHRGRRRGIGGWLSFVGLAGEGDCLDAVEIELPLDAVVRLNVLAGSGDVRIDGLGGTVSVRSGSGDVAVARATGDVEIDIGSGDVDAADCVGSLRIRTGSGDVSLRGGVLAAARFRSGSGDIALRGVGLGEGPFEVQTGAGDVALDVFREDRSDSPIGLRYVALAGDASVGAGFLRVRGRAAADASPLVSVHTAAGDLSARRVAPAAPRVPLLDDDLPPAGATAPGADPGATSPVSASAAGGLVPPEPPLPPGPPALVRTVGVAAPPAPEPPARPEEAGSAPVARTPEATLALLEQVARGDVNVEDALRRLG